MRKLLSILLLLALALGVHSGPPVGQRIAAPRLVAAAGGTTLFLDETGLGSSAAAWSVTRKLRSAYAGSCIRVRRSSDSTEQDIGFSSDALDSSALTTFCSGTDGFIVTVYDQSGGANNLTQATASLQPKIVTSGTIITGANSKPCARFDGSDDKLADTLTLNQPTTGFHIFAQQAWVSGDGIFGGGGGITQSLLQTGSSPIFAMYAGSASANITGFSLSTWNLGTFIFNGASSTWSRNNGTDTTVNPNTGNSSGFTWGSRSNADASCAQVDFQETVLYSAVKNSTDRTTAQNNINAFYALW
jgi:hypothetical protein